MRPLPVAEERDDHYTAAAEGEPRPKPLSECPVGHISQCLLRRVSDSTPWLATRAGPNHDANLLIETHCLTWTCPRR